MSLKNFEINYGYNGEPTTASASFVYKKKLCKLVETTPDMGVLGEQIKTGVPEIDAIAGDFVVIQKSEKKDGGFNTLSYELVDRNAKRLESIAVLVRGVTAPAISPNIDNYDDYRRIYPVAETDLKIGEFGLTSVVLKKNIAVIGRTFSVVNATYGEESATKFYAGGVVVGQAPKGVLSKELENELLNNRKNASLKYGYYLSDLKNLLNLAGYEVEGYPTDSNFILMDFGGNLREVVSSLASMFGLYWYIRGNKITFFTSQSLESFEIPNMTKDTDQNILSASYSKDLAGKSSIGVIYGSSEAKNNTVNFSFDGVPRPVTFRYVGIEKIFGKIRPLLAGLITFFLFSGDEKAFDKIILILMANQQEIVKEEDFTKLYGEETVTGEKVTLDELEKDEKNLEVLRNDLRYFKKYESLYSLASSEGGSVTAPSSTPLYGALKTAAEAFGSLYLSRPLTEDFTKSYDIAASDGLSIYGPYLGSTKIKEVPELEALDLLFKVFFDRKDGAEEITIRALWNVIKGTTGESILDPEKSYHYVGIKDFLLDLSKNEDEEQKPKFEEHKEKVLVAADDVSGTFYTHSTSGTSYVCSGEKEWGNIKKMVESSKSLVKDELPKIKKRVRLIATKVGEDKPDEDEGEEYQSDFVSFKVRGSPQELSSVDILRFEGTNDEASFLNSNFSRLVSPTFQPESSSVTYSGLVIPDENTNPTLSSIGFSFSENGVETTLTFSNRDFVAQDQSVIMAAFSVNSSKTFTKALRTRQKNFLGVH